MREGAMLENERKCFVSFIFIEIKHWRTRDFFQVSKVYFSLKKDFSKQRPLCSLLFKCIFFLVYMVDWLQANTLVCLAAQTNNVREGSWLSERVQNISGAFWLAVA